MRWGTMDKRWSVTNLPSDNLLRADFCLRALDTHFTWSGRVINAISREGFLLEQAKTLRHALLFHWHMAVNCTYVSYKPFKGVCFIWREEQIKSWWYEGDHGNIFVCTLSHWLQAVNKLCFQTSFMTSNVYVKLILKNGSQLWQKTNGGARPPRFQKPARFPA